MCELCKLSSLSHSENNVYSEFVLSILSTQPPIPPSQKRKRKKEKKKETETALHYSYS